MSEHLRLEAEISGRTPEAVEAALIDFIKEQFNAEAERRVQDQGGERTRGGDAIQWITLALSIPAALMTTLDLAERLKLKERVQRLLQRIRSADDAQHGGVLLKIGERPTVDLMRASAGEVLDALTQTPR